MHDISTDNGNVRIGVCDYVPFLNRASTFIVYDIKFDLDAYHLT